MSNLNPEQRYHAQLAFPSVDHRVESDVLIQTLENRRGLPRGQ